MKWIGALMILFACSATGLWMRYRMQKRVTTLQHVIERIRRLTEQIRYTNAPLTELIQHDSVASFPKTTVQSDDPREQWKHSLAQHAEKCGLSEDDIAVLNRFFEQVGRSDAAGEVRFCEEYQTVLSEQLEQAKERLSVKGNLYVTLGCSLGFLASVVLW